jgi:hypothetical protein
MAIIILRSSGLWPPLLSNCSPKHNIAQRGKGSGPANGTVRKLQSALIIPFYLLMISV